MITTLVLSIAESRQIHRLVQHDGTGHLNCTLNTAATEGGFKEHKINSVSSEPSHPPLQTEFWPSE